MSKSWWVSVVTWLGTQGLQILLIIIGSILLARLAGFVSHRVTRSIARGEKDRDSLVQSETAKHRYAVAQVITYVVVALIVVVAAVGVVDRLGVSLTSLVAPATVLGAALGFGAQRVVQDFLAGFFVVTERHYGYGDVVTIWISGCIEPAEGTVEASPYALPECAPQMVKLSPSPMGRSLKQLTVLKTGRVQLLTYQCGISLFLRLRNNCMTSATTLLKSSISGIFYLINPLLLGWKKLVRKKRYCVLWPVLFPVNSLKYPANCGHE